MIVQIVKVTPEAAPTLTEIAIAAKGYWGYPAHWMERWLPALTTEPAYVRDNEVYAAVDAADQIVGWYALTGTGTRLVLDNLWVRPDHIGTGVGRALFEHAGHQAALLGADEIELKADPHAAGFYERMGMQRIGQKNATIDGVERYLPIFRLGINNASITSKG